MSKILTVIPVLRATILVSVSRITIFVGIQMVSPALGVTPLTLDIGGNFVMFRAVRRATTVCGRLEDDWIMTYVIDKYLNTKRSDFIQRHNLWTKALSMPQFPIHSLGQDPRCRRRSWCPRRRRHQYWHPHHHCRQLH